jgi:hypothetical protein
MEKWLTTLDTKEAAAFAALGATVKIISSIHQRTSTRSVRFFIAPLTEDKKWQIGKIRKGLKDGTLLRSHPGHPLLTILRAYQNRDCLIDLIKTGRHYRMVEVPGAPGIHQLVPGDTGLPGLTGTAAAVKTQDIKVAAALITCGFPLLRITGSAATHEFTLAAFQSPSSLLTSHSALGTSPLDAAQLIADWRIDPCPLPFEHPFLQAAHGLSIRELLLREVNKSIDSILISKPRSTSHAVIRADAAPDAWDAAKRFFSGTR